MKFISHRANIDNRWQQAHLRAVQSVVGVARRNAPVDQGRLRGSVHAEAVKRSNAVWSDRVGSSERYAAMREFGGTIRPVRARMLFWKGRDGRTHAAKVVHQEPGGIRRRGPWLRPAGEQYPKFMARFLKQQ